MNSNLHTSSVYDSMAQKKVRIEVEKSLCSDQRSDKDSSVVESEVKNERFSCNRPMKQIQDVKRLMLTGKKDSSIKKRGILGSLIENNIVKRGSRVSYLSRKDGRVLKSGRLSEDGIKCDCCDEMFLLTKFEAHAGSTNHRPAANIFFDDNRSILDCETQLQLESVLPADDKSITDQSDKDSSVVESEVKNERFSCNRPMKQIQDVKRLMLTGKKDSSIKKRSILGSLIENNIVKQGARVSYLSRKDGRVLKSGRLLKMGLSVTVVMRCFC
nr:increased DNA methylation 1-like [Tanacetum cinerariifolium]